MRAVIQRVCQASVEIQGQTVAHIGPGLLVLLGIGREDAEADLVWMARKIPALRIFPDEEGRMNRSLLDTGGACLVVSQFTLLGDSRRGNRPSFIDAMDPGPARILCDAFVARLREQGIPCQTGEFGADMQVGLVNDGPVTIWLDSATSRRGNPR